MNDATEIDQVQEVNSEIDAQADQISELEMQEMLKGIDPALIAGQMAQKQNNKFLKLLHEGKTPQAMAEALNTFVEDGAIPDMETPADSDFYITAADGEMIIHHKLEVIITKENLDNNIQMIHGFVDQQKSHISHTVAMRHPNAADVMLEALAAGEQLEFLTSMATKTRNEMRAGAMNNANFSDAIILLLTTLQKDEIGILSRMFNTHTALGSDDEPNYASVDAVCSGSALTHYSPNGGHTIFSNIERVMIETEFKDNGDFHCRLYFRNYIKPVEWDANIVEFTHEFAKAFADKAAEENSVKITECRRDGLFTNKLLLTGFSGPAISYMLVEVISARYNIEHCILAGDTGLEEDISCYISSINTRNHGVFLKATQGSDSLDTPNRPSMNMKVEHTSWEDDGTIHYAIGVTGNSICPCKMDDSDTLFDVHLNGGVRTDDASNTGFVLTHQPRLQ